MLHMIGHCKSIFGCLGKEKRGGIKPHDIILIVQIKIITDASSQ